MYITPESYDHSRKLFIQSLDTFRSYWPQAKHSSFIVSAEDDLSIDWISAESEGKKDQLIFLTTGIHGIEGFLGSIMIQLFTDEFVKHLDPATTGLLVVHCINPTGMARKYRTNQNNVDLNRNFIEDFSTMAGTNGDYQLIDPLINPKIPVNTKAMTIPGYLLKTIKYLLKLGAGRIREASLKGQYFNQTGIYFGGKELQEETKCLMKLINSWIPVYDKTIHLDMHTGYGPRFGMTLVQSPLESMTSEEAKTKYGIQQVAATNPEEFYSIQGEMSDYIYNIGDQSHKDVYSAAFEFGTYGSSIFDEARSLLTTIAANQLIHHGQKDDQSNWVWKDYYELYFPSDSTWLTKAIDSGRQAFKGILQAEGFI